MFYFIATAQQAISISTCDDYKLKYAIGHAFCVCNFESNSSSGLGTAIIYSHLVYLQKETLTLQLIVLCNDFSIKETQSNRFEVEQSFLCSLSTPLLLIRFCFLLHGTIFDRRTQGPCLILKKNNWGRVEQNCTDRFAHDRHTCVRMHTKSQRNNVYIRATNSVSL